MAQLEIWYCKEGPHIQAQPTKSIDLSQIFPWAIFLQTEIERLASWQTCKVPSANSESKTSCWMHWGTSVARYQPSTCETGQANSTSNCQRADEHSKELLLSRVKPNSESEKSKWLLIRPGFSQSNWRQTSYIKAKEDMVSSNNAWPGETVCGSRKQPPPRNLLNFVKSYIRSRCSKWMIYSIERSWPKIPRSTPPASPPPIVWAIRYKIPIFR